MLIVCLLPLKVGDLNPRAYFDNTVHEGGQIGYHCLVSKCYISFNFTDAGICFRKDSLKCLLQNKALGYV
jgi:hypothetical protein